MEEALGKAWPGLACIVARPACAADLIGPCSISIDDEFVLFISTCYGRVQPCVSLHKRNTLMVR